MDFTLILVMLTLFTGLFSLIKINRPVISQISEFSSSIFPVLFVVLLIRSFFIEPYKIPSGSMIPTLMIGDFILIPSLLSSAFFKTDLFGETIAPVLEVSILFDALETLILV